MTLSTAGPAVPEEADALAAAARLLRRIEDIVAATPGDEALLGQLRELPGGVRGALTLLTFGTPAAFRADLAGDETGTVVLIVDADGEEVRFCLRIEDGECRIVEPVADPTTTIALSAPTFLRVAYKFMDGNDAHLNGLTEVTGDVFTATNLYEWFDTPLVALDQYTTDRTEEAG